jgi:amidophosphoribosyltransferase
MPGLHEECGVFGVWAAPGSGLDVARMTFHGLYALQHRGQESCGIAVNEGGRISYTKDMGLVAEVFNEKILARLSGTMALGHVRYSTTGASMRENAQPLVMKYAKGNLALGHNGNLVNAAELRIRLEKNGAIFQTTIDSEVMAYLIAREHMKKETIEKAVAGVMPKLRGSYSLVVMSDDRLVAARDPLGMRPLSIGRVGDSWVFASETCALDTVGARFVRDVAPGEVVSAGPDGLVSLPPKAGKAGNGAMCIFEYIYFARPDSVIEGVSVYEARKEAGRMLAREHPVDADIVIGVPDSGLAAALGYSEESGLPYADGLIKNRYIGRTFIQPDQSQRETGVMLKLNALRSSIQGKRVVLIDDSIVRGTTSGKIVSLLKDAGATEVHLRVSSPPFKWPCYFGTDIPSRRELVATDHTVEEIRDMIGADSLGYLNIEGLTDMVVGGKCGYCTACFSGEYPMEVPDEAEKMAFEFGTGEIRP